MSDHVLLALLLRFRWKILQVHCILGNNLQLCNVSGANREGKKRNTLVVTRLLSGTAVFHIEPFGHPIESRNQLKV